MMQSLVDKVRTVKPRELSRANINDIVCVDLDGTLVRADLVWESFVLLVKRRPLRALRILPALVRGKACFKQRVAAEHRIDANSLPYRQQLLDQLREMRRAGATLVLVTGSDYAYAEVVASHLGVFDEVIASDGRTNLTGQAKAARLVERFGYRGFHYIGNDWADVPIWRAAASASVVGASPRLARFVTSERLSGQASETRSSRFHSLVRAMRPHQWAKNLLVFVPAICAHTLFRLEVFWPTLLTFAAFSFCASAIYVLNDISDIQADRAHLRKRTRPFAAGDLSLPEGGAAAAVLLGVAAMIALFGISPALALVLLAYVLLTSAYSLVLKQVAVADVFALTGLYVLRIAAGGVATDTPLSSWLLAFALFLFLSLAFVKRYVELLATDGHMPGRGYGPDDALWMHAIGTSAGYMAVLVLALYITAPEVASLYTRPWALWALCPLLLFWVTRLWFRAGRRQVDDDPVLDVFRDVGGYIMLAIAATSLLVAI